VIVGAITLPALVLSGLVPSPELWTSSAASFVPTLGSLLPTSWFEARPWPVLLIVAAIAAAVLIRGADWLVEGASGLAYRLGMPKVIVGATIVSLGTTSPECAVSVLAAFRGNAGLALGNAVGSIIADTALIFGLGAVITRLPADRFILNRQGWVQIGVAAALTGFCFLKFFLQGEDAVISRPVGVILVLMLIGYLALSVRWANAHPGSAALSEEVDVEKAAGRSAWSLLFWLVTGLALVVLGGEVMVASVSEVAVQWGVPEVVIAGTIVAVGTSMPELVVGLTSIRKGHPELLVGNVIGADILNVLFVVGVSALAAPLPVIDSAASRPAIFLELHLPAMMAVLVLFRIYIFGAVKRGYFRRGAGWPLLAMYVAYVAAGFIL